MVAAAIFQTPQPVLHASYAADRLTATQSLA